MPNTMPWYYRSLHASVAYKDAMWILGGRTRPQQALRSDVWRSYDGENWSEVVKQAPWAPRGGHNAVVHNGEIWICGGYDLVAPMNDVWHSADGSAWTRVHEAVPWPPRWNAGATAFGGKLWIAGGRTQTGKLSDVWSSEDGKTWELVNAASPWGPLEGHHLLAFGDKLWIVCGMRQEQSGYSYPTANIWRSADGVTWQPVVQDPGNPLYGAPDPTPWRRAYFGATTFAGRMWIAGGYYGWKHAGPFSEDFYEVYVNDVWSSADGFTWNLVTPERIEDYWPYEHVSLSPWSPRKAHSLVGHRGRLWMAGGYEQFGTHLNQLWVSGTDEGQHSSDLDHDEYLNLSEVLRTVQLYNLGEFHCDAAGEDGYNPGPGDQTCAPHSGDYNPQDWRISLSEPLRVVQLYNSGGYYSCPATDPPTEDGYCPAV